MDCSVNVIGVCYMFGGTVVLGPLIDLVGYIFDIFEY